MSGRGTVRPWVGPVIVAPVVLLATGLALALYRTPEPVPRHADPSVFSAERAMDHVRALAGAPRPVGSAAHAAAREYLMQALRGMGLEPRLQVATAVRGWRAARAENIVARIPGTVRHGPGSAILLTAHYDSVPMSPGAGDAAAAVATILETGRALLAGPPPARDVILLLNSPEEVFLNGATAFAEQHPWAPDVGFVINMDPGGVTGPALMHGTSPRNGRLVAEVGRAVSPLFATSLASAVKDAMGDRNDDFVVFTAAGRAGVDLAFIGSDTHYHAPLDRPGALDPGSLQSLGAYALGLTRHFAAAEEIDRRAPDHVYFNVIGTLFAHYPEAWSLPLALVAAALLVLAARRALRNGACSGRGVLFGAAVHVVAVAVAVGAGVAVWAAIARTDRITGAFLTGDQYGQETFLLLFSALAVASVAGLDALLRPRLAPEAAFLGVQACWILLALIGAFALPGGSYLVLWPAVLAAGSTLVAGRDRAGSQGAAAMALRIAAGVAGAMFVAPVVRTAFGALATGQGPFLMIVVGLAAGLLIPAVRVIDAPLRGATALAALLVAAVALVSILTFRFDAAHPRTDFLVYGLDADEGAAVWASESRAGVVRPDPWTRGFFAGGATRGPLGKFYPYSSATFLQGPAPVLPLAAATADVLEDETHDGRRRVRLRLRSPRGAQVLVGLTTEPVLGLSIDGHAVRNDRLFAFHGVPEEGFELAIESTAGRALGLTLIDESYGLPATALGGDTPPGGLLPERPAGWMAEPGGGLVFTDATLVRHRIDLGGAEGG